jgi:hypothetical protein
MLKSPMLQLSTRLHLASGRRLKQHAGAAALQGSVGRVIPGRTGPDRSAARRQGHGGPAGIAVDLRNNGLAALVKDLSANAHQEAAE